MIELTNALVKMLEYHAICDFKKDIKLNFLVFYHFLYVSYMVINFITYNIGGILVTASAWNVWIYVLYTYIWCIILDYYQQFK